MNIRPLHANPHARSGTWDKASCADALLQISSTVAVLSQQLDRLWNLAGPDIRASVDATLASPFEQIDAALARKIEAMAVNLQSEADSEAA
jgi:hypothetical protein